MENKEENVDLMEKQSGVTDQTESVPAVGAGVGESKTVDPLEERWASHAAEWARNIRSRIEAGS